MEEQQSKERTGQAGGPLIGGTQSSRGLIVETSYTTANRTRDRKKIGEGGMS
jgi:hypothetical protein